MHSTSIVHFQLWFIPFKVQYEMFEHKQLILHHATGSIYYLVKNAYESEKSAFLELLLRDRQKKA